MSTDHHESDSGAAIERDETAIQKLIARFADGIRTLNADLVSSTFHPRALSFCRTPSGICIEPVQAWPEILSKAKIDSTHLFQEQFSVETLNVDIEGTAAVAKVAWNFESCKVIDFYNLLKLESGWLIANQVYHSFPSDTQD